MWRQQGYVEATFTGKPVYSSMHLSNMWGESPDYANHQSSLNLHQMYIGVDGKQRWAYSTLPPKAEWPTIFCRKIKFDEIGEQFPEDMPILDREDRQHEINVRQAHVQRRYRVF